MAVLPGAIPDQFYFTVREDGVASQIDKFAGKQVVSLDYQGLGILRIESTGHDLLTALRGKIHTLKRVTGSIRLPRPCHRT